MNHQQKFETFLELSVALTGFIKTDLLGTGMAFAYFEIFTERVGHTASDELWDTATAILNDTSLDEAQRELAIRVKIMSHSKLGPIARGIIKLWYLGQWEALPGSWRSRYGNHLNDVNEIISGHSYKEGLVWKAIGAHPMGAKQPGFGTWSSPPEKPDDI